ncbi:hypothetical protein XENOCAPTIV_010953, partial [Xenoophorus captivus]
GEKECLNSETAELKQKVRYLQDQLVPLSKQREYQEKEIQRLNRVKIFEEDFRKERSDRERMNEEKEDLRRQVERLQGQITNLTNQNMFGFNSKLCVLFGQGFPWQMSFSQPRGARAVGESSRPPPENAGKDHGYICLQTQLAL